LKKVYESWIKETVDFGITKYGIGNRPQILGSGLIREVCSLVTHEDVVDVLLCDMSQQVLSNNVAWLSSCLRWQNLDFGLVCVMAVFLFEMIFYLIDYLLDIDVLLLTCDYDNPVLIAADIANHVEGPD
jgi:hypothetical protein